MSHIHRLIGVAAYYADELFFATGRDNSSDFSEVFEKAIPKIVPSDYKFDIINGTSGPKLLEYKPELKVGDKVKVIRYGHIYWSSINGKLVPTDMSPHLIGKIGVIDKISGNHYSVEGIKEKHAWYDYQQLMKLQ